MMGFNGLMNVVMTTREHGGHRFEDVTLFISQLLRHWNTFHGRCYLLLGANLVFISFILVSTRRSYFSRGLSVLFHFGIHIIITQTTFVPKSHRKCIEPPSWLIMAICKLASCQLVWLMANVSAICLASRYGIAMLGASYSTIIIMRRILTPACESISTHLYTDFANKVSECFPFRFRDIGNTWIDFF